MAMHGNQPAPRGRLGREINARRIPAHYSGHLNTHACHVNASLAEDGTLTININGRAEYREGAHIGASIDTDEVPEKLAEALRKALQAVLDDGHEPLKEELEREARAAYDFDAAHAQTWAAVESTDDQAEE